MSNTEALCLKKFLEFCTNYLDTIVEIAVLVRRNLRLYSLIGLPIRLASPGIDLEKKKTLKEANTLTNT